MRWVLLFLFTACGPGRLVPFDSSSSSPFVTVARATIRISSDNHAFHTYSSATINYVFGESINFSIDTTNLAIGDFNGDILSLGSIRLASLSDNNLKICGISGTLKCNIAAIRIYTVGTTEGFVNSNGYGIPLTANAAHIVIGLGIENAAIVQSVAIPSNKNKMRLSDFPSPTYVINADFFNGGSGSYSANIVIEYVLGL